MTLPKNRVRVGDYGIAGLFDVTPYVDYVYYYRYKKAGEESWTTWEEYTPSSEIVYIQNLTSSSVVYLFEQKTEAIFQGGVYETWVYESEVSVPPTPQFSCDNWQIDPATPQLEGTWTYTFDVVSDPSYWGDESEIDVEVTIQCYDATDTLRETFVHTPAVSGGQCSDSFTLGIWVADNPDEYGYFVFDVDISVPTSPVVPDATCSHTFLDTWEGSYTATWCCNDVDTIGMYDWTDSVTLNNYCTQTMIESGLIHYKIHYDTDDYSEEESTWEISDGTTVYASGGFPDSIQDVEIGSFTYTGDIDLLKLILEDSYSDGGIAILDWGFTDDDTIWVCNDTDTIGLFDWDYSATLNNYCTKTFPEATTIYYRIHYEADDYSEDESSWEISDGTTVYASGVFPNDTTGTETGSFTYTGDIDLLKLILEDSYGDGGIGIFDWGFTDDADPVSCVSG